MKFILFWIGGFFLFALLVSFFFEVNKVSGASMEPAVNNGTNVIVWKYFLGSHTPKRADIVFYKKASESTSSINFIGRVVAMPKESIRFNNGNLYINNNVNKYKVVEEYLPPGTKTYVNTEDGNSLDWTAVGEYNYLILPDRRDKRLNIEDYLVNKNDITGVMIFQFR